MFRRRRVRTLLNLVDGLPGNSHYMDAVANDEESAAALVDVAESEARERMTDWSAEVRMLALLVDRVGELIGATIAASGTKPPQHKPVPRPETALAAARNARQMALVDELRAAWN